MAVVGVFGEVDAACVTGRDVLGSVRAADGIEGAAEAGAVAGAQRSGRMEEKCGSAGEPRVSIIGISAANRSRRSLLQQQQLQYYQQQQQQRQQYQLEKQPCLLS